MSGAQWAGRAQAELASKPDGRVETRLVPLAEFFVGPGKTVRAPNELLCALRLPLPRAGSPGRFVLENRPGYIRIYMSDFERLPCPPCRRRS